MLSYVVTYTRPPDTTGALKCANPGIVEPLENNSFPFSASNTYSVAFPVGVSRRSLEVSNRPLLSTCLTFSPFDSANTIPLAITTGSGYDMSLDIQAGESAGLPSFSSTLKAITLPDGASPCWMGNFTLDVGGPHAGPYSQRVPAASSHVDSAPQNPWPAKSTSSFV